MNAGTVVSFTPSFDRAVAACAHAQALVTRSAEAARRAREMRASSLRLMRGALQTREAWRGADRTYVLMKGQVASIARAMRDAGMTRDDASTAIRAHIRFVLYDGGLSERDAEPVVERAIRFIEETFQAA